MSSRVMEDDASYDGADPFSIPTTPYWAFDTEPIAIGDEEIPDELTSSS